MGYVENIFNLRHIRFFWKKESQKKIPAVFLPNPKSGIEIVQTPTGPKCIFSHTEGTRALFLDSIIASTGITRWELQVQHLNVKRRTYVSIGVVAGDSIGESDDRVFVDNGPPSFTLCSTRADQLGLYIGGYEYFRSYSGWSDSSDEELETSWYRTYKPEEPLRIAVEVDAHANKLYFFTNKVKGPYAFQNVNWNLSLHFGMEVKKPTDESAEAGETPTTLTSISLCRLVAPTVSSVHPQFYECRDEYKAVKSERRRRR